MSITIGHWHQVEEAVTDNIKEHLTFLSYETKILCSIKETDEEGLQEENFLIFDPKDQSYSKVGSDFTVDCRVVDKPITSVITIKVDKQVTFVFDSL